MKFFLEPLHEAGGLDDLPRVQGDVDRLPCHGLGDVLPDLGAVHHAEQQRDYEDARRSQADPLDADASEQVPEKDDVEAHEDQECDPRNRDRSTK